MSRTASLSIRLYRWLSNALPEDFLRSYGPEMITAGEDTIRDVAAKRGYRGLALLMFHLLFDLIRRLPAEHLSEFLTDVRHAVRTLARSKGMVIAVSLSTGFAIAISLGTYSEMRMVFHAVPGIGDPGNLLTIQTPLSFPDYERYADRAGPFAAVAAYQGPVVFSISRGGTTERLWGQIVTPNYFEVLQVPAVLGRTFSADNESTSAASVIISEGHWQRHFGGSRDAIGQTLDINGQSATIVGVAARDFVGAAPLTSAAEMWVATNGNPQLAPELTPDTLRDRSQTGFRLIGRLKAEMTVLQAEAQLDVIAKDLLREKDGNTTEAASTPARITTLFPGGQLFPMRKEDLPMALALPLTLEGLLLLLACTNASTLLLAKASARRREITIRTALGASRRRMIKQLLTESVTLGICSGIIGFSLALLINYQTRQFVQRAFPPYTQLDLSLGWFAGALALGISVLAGVFFGVLPAFKATRVDLPSGLKAGPGWFLPGYRWFSSRNALVLLQVASCTTVVIVVGIIGLGVQSAFVAANFGFEPRDLYTFSIDPLREGYSNEQTWQLLNAIPERLRQFPGITHAGVALNPPVGDLAFRTMAPALAGDAPLQEVLAGSGSEKRAIPRVTHEFVGSEYFETLMMKPLRGRLFTNADIPQDAHTIVINARLAKEAFPSEDPIGRQLIVGGRVCDVIGVVDDFRTTSMLTNPDPFIFHLLGPDQIARPASQGLTVVVRGERNSDILEELRAYGEKLNPRLTVFNVNRQKDRLVAAMGVARFQTLSYGIIGLLGLVLAAIGLAGVTGYAVAQRTKEIGIRVALGATRLQVLRIVLRESALLIGAGMLAGEVFALGLSGLLNAWYVRVYEVTRASSSDPLILVGTPALLAGLTMLSCYLPARRALRIDPVSALRED
jgi:macrolide transport system ATP-binding/permease protein